MNFYAEGEIRGQNVNIRQEPGLKSKVLGQLNTGAKISVYKPFAQVDGHDWAYIKYGLGGSYKGWVALDYIVYNI